MNSLRIVLDSNVLISAYVFGGKPENVFKLIVSEKIHGITSAVLISEFLDILRKKFGVSQAEILEIEEEIKNTFELVYPSRTINVSRDPDDNRVIEAAVEGNCDYIITGDKDLLDLKKFKNIKILTAEQFLQIHSIKNPYQKN